MPLTNDLNQPIGFPVKNWKVALLPDKTEITGDYCKLVLLDTEKHAGSLYQAFTKDKNSKHWTYLPYGPFDTFELFNLWLTNVSKNTDPLFYSLINKQDNLAVGLASYLSIDSSNGTIEVGHIHFSPTLQKTCMATECMFLMMKHAFDTLGYRRYEWKCNSLNNPSRKAALRLGFTFEGVSRQAGIYKGRNRDTAWYSIIDSEWPALKQAFNLWLSVDNFDAQGRQLKRLSTFLR